MKINWCSSLILAFMILGLGAAFYSLFIVSPPKVPHSEIEEARGMAIGFAFVLACVVLPFCLVLVEVGRALWKYLRGEDISPKK